MATLESKEKILFQTLRFLPDGKNFFSHLLIAIICWNPKSSLRISSLAFMSSLIWSIGVCPNVICGSKNFSRHTPENVVF